METRKKIKPQEILKHFLSLYFIVSCYALFGQYNEELIHQLDSMVKADQNARSLVRRINNGEIDSLNSNFALNQMVHIDSLNHPLLEAIFKKYGYPGFDIAGEKGSHDFWLLVQHQDYFPEFQDSVLLAMKVQVDKGNAPKDNYAYLVDRVMLKKENMQLYGTQMQLNADSSSYEPRTLKYPDRVDVLRKTMGLPPMSAYIEIMNDRYRGTLKKEEE